MRTVHHARIAAPLATAFGLARDVEGWPALLPHHRWCRVLERGPQGLTFAMGGWIRGWPARWVAVQEVDPDGRRFTIRHIGGITKGMVVEWLFAPAGDTVNVTVAHDLVIRWPLIGRLVSDLIVGPIFIDYIVPKTLRAVKGRAEAMAAGSAVATGARA